MTLAVLTQRAYRVLAATDEKGAHAPTHVAVSVCDDLPGAGGAR